MISSRLLDDLLPVVKIRAEAFIVACSFDGIQLLVTSTYRDNDSQAELYAQGRTKPGRIITNARPGFSFHQFRCAFDVVPLVNGKCVWDDEAMWEKIGKIGEDHGLEWAGRWMSFREKPHFQYTGGKTIKQLQAGATIK